ncbi:MAG: hypothetical protein HY291_02355 [Planctomycetes bacterium]|nr:hypothetical protein [Planctomycetota bacterium]
MSDEKPMEPSAAPPAPNQPANVPALKNANAEGGCLGAVLLLGFWTVVWLGVCFLVYWKVSTVLAALVFFLPPLGFFLWVIFTKPAGPAAPKGGLDRKQ